LLLFFYVQRKTSEAHTGGGYFKMGVSNLASGSLTSETFYIPLTAVTANITFWVNVITEDSSVNNNDQLFVELIDGLLGTTLYPMPTITNLNPTNGSYVVQGAFNIFPYRLLPLKLRFRVVTDIDKQTTFRIDDILIGSVVYK